MEPINIHRGIVATLNRSNVDTDAIIPKQYLKSIKRSGFFVHSRVVDALSQHFLPAEVKCNEGRRAQNPSGIDPRGPFTSSVLCTRHTHPYTTDYRRVVYHQPYASRRVFLRRSSPAWLYTYTLVCASTLFHVPLHTATYLGIPMPLHVRPHDARAPRHIPSICHRVGVR